MLPAAKTYSFHITTHKGQVIKPQPGSGGRCATYTFDYGLVANDFKAVLGGTRSQTDRMN
jgi:hypothetical protein